MTLFCSEGMKKELPACLLAVGSAEDWVASSQVVHNVWGDMLEHVELLEVVHLTLHGFTADLEWQMLVYIHMQSQS